MKINVTRRDVLKFGAGAAAGVMVTPAPWKAIDDLAIWTQNWKWIPVPPKGPVSMRAGNCPLCPAGCAVKARCIGGKPVSMQPAARAQGEALCPLGLTGHHLPYHPARITAPVRIVRGGGSSRRIPVSLEAVLSEMKKAASAGPVAVLDTRPGRSISSAWRVYLASVPGGTYVPDPSREGASMTALDAMTAGTGGSIAPDLANAKTIVSFGAPLAEGWGDPAVTRRIVRRDADAPFLLQVEPLHSPTAEVSSRWLPVRPGSEAVLALAMGNVLLAENLIDAKTKSAIPGFAEYAAIVARFTPAAAERATGIAAADVIAATREIATRRPALVVAGEVPGGGRLDEAAETAIFALDLLLSDGVSHQNLAERTASPDGFDAATPRAAVTELHAVRDRSISLLVVDASEGDAAVPWRAIERKLNANALVVALTPFSTGIGSHADYLVPAAPFTEGLHEIPTPFDSSAPMLAIAAPMIEPRAKAFDAATILHALTGAGATTSEEIVRARAAQIFAAGAGSLVNPSDGTARTLAEAGSADAMWEALIAGERWIGEAGAPLSIAKTSLLGTVSERLASVGLEGVRIADANRPLVLLPRATRDVTASAAVSPVMTKIYQESGLRRQAGTIAINPRTARQLALHDGAEVRLDTGRGAVLAHVVLDEEVMPGVVEAAAGPDAATLGDGRRSNGERLLDVLSGEPAWRATAVSVVEG